MKIKLLAVAVAGILLSGCNDDNGPLNSAAVQAFDPAVQNMKAEAICADGTTETSKTDYYGNAKFFERTIQVSPETCTFTFTGGNGAQDISNGKLIGSDVVYIIPKGMAQSNGPITASPLTTLIARELEATGQEYSETAATDVLVALGLTDILNNTSVSELLSNTEAVLNTLSKETDKSGYQLLAATTATLTEVLRQSTDSVAKIAAATEQFAEDSKLKFVVGGTPVKITISSTQVTNVVADPTTISAPENKPAVVNGAPVAPPKKPTGGTGGTTGGTTGGSGA